MVLLAVNFDNLHQILQSLYVDMMPLCSQMTGVAKGLAGLGALFYVAYRVWQSLARAEPIDVFPLLRPFALGLCIMFFPTLVLGTLNSVMSPIVTGTHRILETQTFDMNEYRKQKDKLEFEAMKRNPETAYLVDKESFDNKLDELGALDAIEACGMYVDRAMYNMKKAVQKLLPRTVGTDVQCRSTCHRYAENILPHRPLDTRTHILCDILLGRLPRLTHAVVCPIHQHLSMAARERPFQQRACTHTGTDVTEGHRAVVRSQLHP